MFVDLKAANDILFGSANSPTRQIVHGQHIRNCNFALNIGTGSQKRLRQLRNGVS